MRGQYLLCIDADDWIEEKTVEVLLGKLCLHDADVVVYGIIFHENGRSVMKKITDKDTEICNTDIINKIILDNDIYGGGYTVNKFWRIGSEDSFSLFDRDLMAYEDKLWCILNYLKLKKIILVPDCLYNYDVHEGSLSHYSHIQWDKMYSIIEAYKRIWLVTIDNPFIRDVSDFKYRIEILNFLGSCIKKQRFSDIRRYYPEAKLGKYFWFTNNISLFMKLRFICILLISKIIRVFSF